MALFFYKIIANHSLLLSNKIALLDNIHLLFSLPFTNDDES